MEYTRLNTGKKKTKVWFFLLLIIYIPSCTQAQQDAYKAIKSYYDNLSIDGDDVLIPFVKSEEINLSSNEKLFQIILVRHGTPIFNKRGWHTFYGAQTMLNVYDTVSVYPLTHMPVDLRSAIIKHIYSSPLPRARATAQQMVIENIGIQYDSLFIEFRNEIVPIPWIRFPYRFWSVTSRLLWMAGLHSERVPSLPDEKKRAKIGARKLQKMAYKEGKVVLVAHGYLNRYLIRYLKKEGWRHSYDGGYHYANVQVMSKIIKNR